MADTVRTKRKYDSRRRQEQAATTRRAILDAAQRLFERDGYAATTMDDVAAEAGVALKTVYSGFTTKSGVLRALWDLLLKGDSDDAPVAERPWYREMLDEADPERQLRLNASNARMVKSRIGRLLGVIRSAAAVDGDSAALWALIQSDFYANQRVLVEAIHERGGLRADLDVKRATDILWTLNHPDVWLLLVAERGWTAEEFESWFADATCNQLLGNGR
ncbi:MAG TPA: helix-turn-helix domain-containing protein [Acidimicrobiales bacterium]|nr:helix-turn-helix domain-containing protein [Acidimicrobiales bacterium]